MSLSILMDTLLKLFIVSNGRSEKEDERRKQGAPRKEESRGGMSDKEGGETRK